MKFFSSLTNIFRKRYYERGSIGSNAGTISEVLISVGDEVKFDRSVLEAMICQL